MIAIIDYGMGNLRSVQKAFERVEANAVVTQDPKDIIRASKVVLPGVGAIKPAMEKLESLGMIEVINKVIKDGKPFLGICLGFQLLFGESQEGGIARGLDILPGSVKIFTKLKVPHMGWNQIRTSKNDCTLFNDIPDNSSVYFCHSYFVQPDDNEVTAATTDYGITFASAVQKENIFGFQFHPEKSQKVGLRILQNFKEVSL